MKIIHCADIHLGSQMDSHMPREKAAVRRSELRSTLMRMTEYARENGIFHIILAGDIFDGARPLKADRELFYNLISASPEISFYYLRGNHDLDEDYSHMGLTNLKTFSDSWQTYELQEGVTLTGCEMTDGNCTALYHTLSLDRSKTNIVTLHGQISASRGAGLIHTPSLADRNIDYLALGHIHSYSEGRLDSRGAYAYSGCLEGRGFDECGEKGFVLLDIENRRVTHKFIRFASRMIRSVDIDISDCDGVYSLIKMIKECGFSSEDLVRVSLLGEASFDLSGIEDTLLGMLEPLCFFARVRNRASERLDLSYAEGELSLRGEFIRTVMRYPITDDEKRRIINLGIKALSGRNL